MLENVKHGLAQADRLREFIADAAGPHGGAEFSVFGDLAVIDDMISDLNRVKKTLSHDAHVTFSNARVRSLKKTFSRLDAWIEALDGGRLRPGGFQDCRPAEPNTPDQV